MLIDTLYDDLLNLASDESSGFFYADHEFDGRVYRVFNYRLSSYQHWIKPNALYGRGTTFDVTGEPTLVSLCMPKFFNVGENPMAPTEEFIDNWAEFDLISDKSDGSLVTCFLSVDDRLMVKSKGSFASSQAIAAREMIENDVSLEVWILEQLNGGSHSVNFEYVAPDNLIVLRYREPRLIYLNKISNFTGELIPSEECVDFTSVDDIRKMTGVEGVVAYMKNHPMRAVKIKTDWYVSLHRIRDNISSKKNVIIAVLNEASDDMKSAFPEFKDHIESIESEVIGLFNRVESGKIKMLSYVDYSMEEGKTQKEIALGSMEESKEIEKQLQLPEGFGKLLFSLAMSHANGKEFNSQKFNDKIVEVLK